MVGASSSKWEANGMFSADGEFVQFIQPVSLDKPVESWLCDIERSMRATLKDSLRKCLQGLQKMTAKRDKWVTAWPGQMVITASQMQWTSDVTKALAVGKEKANKSELKALKKKQVSVLNRYSEAIRGELSKVMRLKVVALVTVEVHARDVLDRLAKAGCCDANAFDWLCQLRLYWEKGPAGTGKTETVKDLGKAMGTYVIVVNCSEGLDYKSMGRMYSGLAQTGAWGPASTSFNRIQPWRCFRRVAQQKSLIPILSALRPARPPALTKFSSSERQEIRSGYAGRSELPDNLKSMFRPISMVVPDSTLIAEITLFGEGFSNCKVLAKKVFTLYSLAEQQLSKQDHYDFGLRALTSLLRYAGRKRQACPGVPGEEILLTSMKDMNLAKLTSADLPLFNDIIQDLFPGVDAPTIHDGKSCGSDSWSGSGPGASEPKAVILIRPPPPPPPPPPPLLRGGRRAQKPPAARR
ncbi:hypothetical protein CRUP_022560 [Coryphaenoides rupestris]|nr:hypothetical protein CRUP_022560 [Coryphaenoides rupestris]